jgi:hypothetical protein
MEMSWDELGQITSKSIQDRFGRARRLPDRIAPGPTNVVSPSGRYVVFRVSGRRLAFPVERVLAVGRLNSTSRLSRRLEIDGISVPVKDLKGRLRMMGEAGELFVAVAGDESAIAWSVDGIEKVQTGEIRLVGNGPIKGALIPSEGGVPWAPVYLLDPRLV